MKVVNNSSPLMFLSALGLLDVLRIEFGEVLIPEMVYQEVTANDLKGSREVKDADEIKVVAVWDTEYRSSIASAGCRRKRSNNPCQ